MTRARRGSAAVEFAFWLTTFLILLVVTIDLAYFLSTYMIVQRAVRDGARHASTVLEDPPATGDDIEAAARDHTQSVLSGAGIPCGAGCFVETTWVDEGGYRWIDVKVTYPVTALTRMVSLPITSIAAEFSMMTQQQ